MGTQLKASKAIQIRYSEVDSMNVVWHGSYLLYFEDAREEFGKKYGLTYMTYFRNGYFAPVVDLSFKYKKALNYESKPVVDICFCPTDAAKIVFDYIIRDADDEQIIYCTGRSIQVFMDLEYQLVWDNPSFFIEWKKKWHL